MELPVVIPLDPPPTIPMHISSILPQETSQIDIAWQPVPTLAQEPWQLWHATIRQTVPTLSLSLHRGLILQVLHQRPKLSVMKHHPWSTDCVFPRVRSSRVHSFPILLLSAQRSAPAISLPSLLTLLIIGNGFWRRSEEQLCLLSSSCTLSDASLDLLSGLRSLASFSCLHSLALFFYTMLESFLLPMPHISIFLPFPEEQKPNTKLSESSALFYREFSFWHFCAVSAESDWQWLSANPRVNSLLTHAASFSCQSSKQLSTWRCGQSASLLFFTSSLALILWDQVAVSSPVSKVTPAAVSTSSMLSFLEHFGAMLSFKLQEHSLLLQLAVSGIIPTVLTKKPISQFSEATKWFSDTIWEVWHSVLLSWPSCNSCSWWCRPSRNRPRHQAVTTKLWNTLLTAWDASLPVYRESCSSSTNRPTSKSLSEVKIFAWRPRTVSKSHGQTRSDSPLSVVLVK